MTRIRVWGSGLCHVYYMCCRCARVGLVHEGERLVCIRCAACWLLGTGKLYLGPRIAALSGMGLTAQTLRELLVRTLRYNA